MRRGLVVGVTVGETGMSRGSAPASALARVSC